MTERIKLTDEDMENVTGGTSCIDSREAKEKGKVTGAFVSYGALIVERDLEPRELKIASAPGECLNVSGNEPGSGPQWKPNSKALSKPYELGTEHVPERTARGIC